MLCEIWIFSTKLLFLQKNKKMNIEIRKLNFIQEFLRFPSKTLLEKFEAMLKQERTKLYEAEIKPMTMKEYAQKVDKALDDYKNKKILSAAHLKKNIRSWK